MLPVQHLAPCRPMFVYLILPLILSSDHLTPFCKEIFPRFPNQQHPELPFQKLSMKLTSVFYYKYLNICIFEYSTHTTRPLI